MSVHEALVVKIENIQKHPNADLLSIVQVFGFQCIIRTSDLHEGDLACFIEPDTLVDVSRPEFEFLKDEARTLYGGRARIKGRKFRGIHSQGLLVRVNWVDNIHEGMNLWDYFELQHYDPEVHQDVRKKMKQGKQASPPSGFHPKYDVENIRKYPDVFEPGELVVVTEKVHGSNWRATYDGEIHVGTRTTWRKNKTNSLWDHFWANFFYSHETIRKFVAKHISKNFVVQKIESQREDMFWSIIDEYPQIEEFLLDNPQYTLYGEIYGPIQKGFDYGSPDKVRFVAFDVLDSRGKWVDCKYFLSYMNEYCIPCVPIIEKDMPFDYEKILALAEGKTLFLEANHIREGVVVRTMKEAIHPKIGRKQLKVVSQQYLEKN